MGGSQSKAGPTETNLEKNTMGNNDGSDVRDVSREKATSKSVAESPVHGNDSGTGGGDVISGGGCPMKKQGGGYLGGWFGGKNPHDGLKVSGNPQTESVGGCPVKGMDAKIRHDDGTSGSNVSDRSEGSGGGGCPVKSGRGSGSQVQYNVYSQPIDPKNNMPSVANQLPSPAQTEKMSVERVQSTIPKGGTEDGSTWTYPSPQMFYNALARKNKLGDTKESEIDSVVALHNNMNEKTWAKVMEWESVNTSSNSDNNNNTHNGSKLLKFMGRPSDLSPKAMFKHYLLGHPLPFDRHDWTILRTDGTQVRYVIDYYHDDTRASEEESSGHPDLHDRDAVKSILVDVRPALDSPSAFLHRAVAMPYARRVAKTSSFEPLDLWPTSELRDQVSESKEVWRSIQENVRQSQEACTSKSMVLKREDLPEDQRTPSDTDTNENNDYQTDTNDKTVNISREEAVKIATSFATMLQNCQDAQKQMDECQSEEECAKASLLLTMCMGKLVCPVQHEAVALSLAKDDFDSTDERAAASYHDRLNASLETMSLCIQERSRSAALAKQQHPDVFRDLRT